MRYWQKDDDLFSYTCGVVTIYWNLQLACGYGELVCWIRSRCVNSTGDTAERAYFSLLVVFGVEIGNTEKFYIRWIKEKDCANALLPKRGNDRKTLQEN